jgi:hypothetical protein
MFAASVVTGHQLTQRQRRRRRALPRRRVDDGKGLLGGHTSRRGNEELETRAAPRTETQRQERRGSWGARSRDDKR